MKTREFQQNPIGTDFDPEELIRRLQSGEDRGSIKKYNEFSLMSVPPLPMGVKWVLLALVLLRNWLGEVEVEGNLARAQEAFTKSTHSTLPPIQNMNLFHIPISFWYEGLSE
jgi:hypothetical protein